MADCANCEHPVDSHALDGCDYSGQGPDACPCPFEYDGYSFKAKLSKALKPTEEECRNCGCSFGWQENESVDYVANPDRVKAADGQAGGSHYLEMPIQPWQIIDAFGLGYYEGSILSYLLRAGRKGSKLEDLKKAGHFLEKLIELEEGGQ